MAEMILVGGAVGRRRRTILRLLLRLLRPRGAAAETGAATIVLGLAGTGVAERRGRSSRGLSPEGRRAASYRPSYRLVSDSRRGLVRRTDCRVLGVEIIRPVRLTRSGSRWYTRTLLGLMLVQVRWYDPALCYGVIR